MPKTVVFLFLLLLPVGVQANEPSSGYCDTIHAQIGGVLVAWQGYPAGWILPDDLELVSVFDYPQDGGLWRYYSQNENADYYYDFWSYAVTGTPAGAHSFCGPYKVVRHEE